MDDMDVVDDDFGEFGDVEEDIGGLARANEMIDRRIVPRTRQGYDSHIKKFVKWLHIHHPAQIRNALLYLFRGTFSCSFWATLLC